MSDKSFASHYANLRAAQWPSRDEAHAFETHVLACILATGLAEAERTGSQLSDCIGLTGSDILDILVSRFPLISLKGWFLDALPEPVVDMEEGLVRDLLMAHRGSSTPASGWLASAIARRGMRNDHLWQDLGLFDRGELGRLLKTHFPRLHAGNTSNMRWKKYFYRKLCEAEGFSLCTAPSCSVCSDFQSCFGNEDGMSRLAVRRLETDTAASGL